MNKKNNQMGLFSSSSTSTSDLIDAKLEEHQSCGGSKHCPGCGHKLQGKPDWVGLPAGVKFDPTDQELIDHLEAKVEGQKSKSHPLIDEFIPTIEGEDGICYTHPEKLPGVTRDGLSRHFFHRPSKAYTTGTRKRRKIQTECDLQGGETRWHKTGKTRPVVVNGKQKGCKKILVLYTNFGKNRKPEKTNWVMHQYHLGQNEEEKEGELVVSKIFYQTQPRQCNWSEKSNNNISSNIVQGDHHHHPQGNLYNTNIDHQINRLIDGANKEMISQRDEFSAPARDNVVVSVPVVSSYADAVDHIQQFKADDQFGFLPFRKQFEEGGNNNIGEASLAREAQAAASVTQHHVTHHEQAPRHHHHHHHHQTTTAFHVSMPTHSISTMISPPPLRHASSIVFGQDHHQQAADHSDFHLSRIIHQLPSHNFEEQTHEQQHNKLGGRSASGLEELIMGCSSTNIKPESSSSVANSQEAEWLKYSTFWPEPDNQDHHG